MSLCDGGAGMQMTNGQGGGAVAEVGAFKGRLGDRDIKFIEDRLMKKVSERGERGQGGGGGGRGPPPTPPRG